MSTAAINVHDFAQPGTVTTTNPGFFDRLIETRTRHAEGRVGHFLTRRSDVDLAGLGFTADEIKVIRRTGKMPARRTR